MEEKFEKQIQSYFQRDPPDIEVVVGNRLLVLHCHKKLLKRSALIRSFISTAPTENVLLLPKVDIQGLQILLQVFN